MIPIILLHHNEPEFLEICIKSIKKNTKHPHEIIIVDNCSTEEIKNRIKKIFQKYKNYFQ